MADITLLINGSEDPLAGYITWAPVKLTIKNSSAQNVTVDLTSRSATGAITRVVFLDTPGTPETDTISVLVNANSEKDIYTAGKFQPRLKHNGASADSKDVTIEARYPGNNNVVASLDLMIRIRKNANELSVKARQDFISALAKLNGIKVDSDNTPGAGKGIYCTEFLEMHVAGATENEHSDSMFLPWHRFYLLDLERLLQGINPSVSLPYWRFDQPAPNVFTSDFMGDMQQINRNTTRPGGAFDRGGTRTPLAKFATNNFLSQWQINNVAGIPRTARFNPATQPANGVTDGISNTTLRDQATTMALGKGTTQKVLNDELGGKVSGNQEGFSRMEGSPHGAAHVSFNGYINFVPVAPQDPLFFLLHCNIDRLWSYWQFLYDRDVVTQAESYPYQVAGSANPWKVVSANQWPWDGTKSFPGNISPPGKRAGNFTKSLNGRNFNNGVPAIQDAIDPYGLHQLANNLGFGYDDVPFEFSRVVPAAVPV